MDLCGQNGFQYGKPQVSSKMNSPKYLGMKNVHYTMSQEILLNDYLENQTGNVVMMLSVKWKKPYINSGIIIRGNIEYTNLNPELKDIVQQLAFNSITEFKKKHAVGKLITIYHGAKPVEGQPERRGMMACHIKFDEKSQEDDYWVTFGDTGEDLFKPIVNSYGAEFGAGILLH